MAVRSIFFTGKGGVGKSTLAAAAAVALADRGKRVLLLSLDPAHNQSDIFSRQFGEQPVTVQNRFEVVEPDIDRWIAQYLAEVEERVRTAYSYLTTLSLEHHFRVLRHSPGLEEFALRRLFHDALARWETADFIIADMPPTALAVRFFASPTLSLTWIRHLLDLRREIRARREMITRIRIGKTEVETDRVLRTLESEKQRNDFLRQLFADPSRCAVQLVINPDPLSWKEGTRIRHALQPLGIPLHRCVLNKAVGDDIEIPGELSDVPMTSVPCMAQSPTGLEDLRLLVHRLDTEAFLRW